MSKRKPEMGSFTPMSKKKNGVQEVSSSVSSQLMFNCCNSFSNWIEQNTQSEPEKISVADDFEYRELLPINDDWIFSDSIVEKFDGDSASRVYYINQTLKRRGCKTSITEKTTDQPCPRPDGLYVLHSLKLGSSVYEIALNELKRLFDDEDNNPTALATLRGRERGYSAKTNLTILFLGKNPNVHFLDVMCFLFEKYRPLADFVLTHALAYLKIVDGCMDDLYKSSLTFFRYNPNAGLRPHIDGVGDFGNTFGPIFTLAMGSGTKYLDVLPTIVSDLGRRNRPIRIFTEQFQSILLQGPARVEYTHSVPFGVQKECMTIALKFGAIKNTTKQVKEYRSELLKSSYKLIELN